MQSKEERILAFVFRVFHIWYCITLGAVVLLTVVIETIVKKKHGWQVFADFHSFRDFQYYSELHFSGNLYFSNNKMGYGMLWLWKCCKLFFWDINYSGVWIRYVNHVSLDAWWKVFFSLSGWSVFVNMWFFITSYSNSTLSFFTLMFNAAPYLKNLNFFMRWLHIINLLMSNLKEVESSI